MLFDNLKNNKQLKTLILSIAIIVMLGNNKIEASGAKAIAEVLKINDALSALDLRTI